MNNYQWMTPPISIQRNRYSPPLLSPTPPPPKNKKNTCQVWPLTLFERETDCGHYSHNTFSFCSTLPLPAFTVWIAYYSWHDCSMAQMTSGQSGDTQCWLWYLTYCSSIITIYVQTMAQVVQSQLACESKGGNNRSSCYVAFIKHKTNQVPSKYLKGALDNILKFYFWLNFIYHVKCNCQFTNTKRKIQKFLLKLKKSSIFVKHT